MNVSREQVVSAMASFKGEIRCLAAEKTVERLGAKPRSSGELFKYSGAIADLIASLQTKD